MKQRSYALICRSNIRRLSKRLFFRKGYFRWLKVVHRNQFPLSRITSFRSVGLIWEARLWCIKCRSFWKRNWFVSYTVAMCVAILYSNENGKWEFVFLCLTWIQTYAIVALHDFLSFVILINIRLLTTPPTVCSTKNIYQNLQVLLWRADLIDSFICF